MGERKEPPRSYSTGSDIACGCSEGVGETPHGKPKGEIHLPGGGPTFEVLAADYEGVRAVSREKLRNPRERDSSIQPLDCTHLGGIRVESIPNRMADF